MMDPWDLIVLFKSKHIWNLKKFCRVWEYRSVDGQFYSHSDVRCMIYNVYKRHYDLNPEVSTFLISGLLVDFETMTESRGDQTRDLRVLDQDYVRSRKEDTERKNPQGK